MNKKRTNINQNHNLKVSNAKLQVDTIFTEKREKKPLSLQSQTKKVGQTSEEKKKPHAYQTILYLCSNATTRLKNL